ncbi:MAG: hypothetical protein PHE55_21070 [Methylococcaceae bacterium]|nr:hypothetical protein [Methylococcaceae bacterium]
MYWIFLDWKERAEGGKPAAYLVQRREMPDGAWTLIGIAIESEITLLDQPRGKALEYRVLAVTRPEPARKAIELFPLLALYKSN